MKEIYSSNVEKNCPLNLRAVRFVSGKFQHFSPIKLEIKGSLQSSMPFSTSREIESICECTIYKYTSVCTMDCIFSWSQFRSIFVQGGCPTSASSTNPDPSKEKEHPNKIYSPIYLIAIPSQINIVERWWYFSEVKQNLPASVISQDNFSIQGIFFHPSGLIFRQFLLVGVVR